jgi:hypothetical protein
MSVAALLLSLIGADLWIHVNPPDECTRSAQLVEALEEPVLSLRNRLPRNATIGRYLDELEWARCGLSVHVVERDSSLDVECPALGFSRYETPRPILREAFVHPVAICEHLRYVSALADRGMLRLKSGGCRWLNWSIVSKRDSDIGVMQTVEMLEMARPQIDPFPPVRVNPPWRLTTRYWNAVSFMEEVDRSECDTGAYMRALDMGTGIIVGGN